MHFTRTRTALIGLGAATLFCSASPAAAFDRMEQRKTLSAALNDFSKAMSRMAPDSQAMAQNVASEVMVKLVEIDHLQDLEDLLAATHEPAPKKLLAERLSRLRTRIDIGCRSLAMSWSIFAKQSQDPVLLGEITATQQVIEQLCASVRN